MAVKVLIAENQSPFRQAVADILSAKGFDVHCVDNGKEAWNLIRREKDIRLVIADYDLAEIKGSDLCQRIRRGGFPFYIYVILLIEQNQRKDVIQEMGEEADDFLSRPFVPEELYLRLRTGERIVALEEDLWNQNLRLQRANKIMSRDLEAGRDVQKSLMPQLAPNYPNIEFSFAFVPSAYVSGDIFNIFRLDENHIGLYSIDVSGHGVPAALFSVTLSQKMKHNVSPQGLLKVPLGNSPCYRINPPERVVALLDEEDMLGRYDRYFTMVYAVINIRTGLVTFCRAGHNWPLVIHGDGTSEYIEGGGPPVGFGISNIQRNRQRVRLKSKDRFILFSDGINEAYSSAKKINYGLERIEKQLRADGKASIDETFRRLLEDVKLFLGEDEISDDVSMIGFEWTAPSRRSSSLPKRKS